MTICHLIFCCVQMVITTAMVLLCLHIQSGSFEGGFREVALRVHNELRVRHKLSPLKLDSGLNVVAQRHAAILATSEKFYGSGGGYGRQENLWAFYGDLRTLSDDVSQATRDWFDGQPSDVNLIKSNPPVTILSKEAQLLGVGAETNKRGYSVVVANYL